MNLFLHLSHKKRVSISKSKCYPRYLLSVTDKNCEQSMPPNVLIQKGDDHPIGEQ